MLKIKNLANQTTAILKNAYNVSYEKPVNQIWSAGFNLPLNDPHAKKVKLLNYVDITDTDGEYIGLFRIINQSSKLNSDGRYVSYDCLHVLSTLMDYTISGYQQTKKGWTTTQVINWLLSFQDVPHWKLGRCDFDRLFEYSFENENGLASALFSITEVFPEEYMWTYDTSSYPWTINLIKPPTKPVCRIREGWNLKDLTVSEDASNLINKLTFLGKGDGINNLNFKKINGGKDYVEDVASQAEFGLIEHIKKDERFLNEESLLESAKGLLERAKRPKITWQTTAVDLIKSIPTKWTTTRIPEIDRLRSGQVVQLWTSLFGTVDLRIMNEKKKDVFGDPGNIQLDINYIGGDFTTTMADLERQLEIYKLSSVGATNKDTVPFAENCDESYPLVVKFYCEEELKRINKILLTYDTEKYRAYSRATKGGGARVTGGTTSGGGAFVSGSSTSSGGGTTQGSTTSSGGGQTSSANGDHVHEMFLVTSGAPPSGNAVPLNAGGGGVLYAQTNLPSGSVLNTRGSSGDHSHTVAAHVHNFSITIPAHVHNFSINIPNHTHDFNFTLPDHVHEIDYGIWEDNGIPTRVEIKIDDTVVTTLTSLSADRVDIVDFLYKQDSLIVRGWHKIQIKPIGARARFVGQCTVYGFIGSTEGAEL